LGNEISVKFQNEENRNFTDGNSFSGGTNDKDDSFNNLVSNKEIKEEIEKLKSESKLDSISEKNINITNYQKKNFNKTNTNKNKNNNSNSHDKTQNDYLHISQSFNAEKFDNRSLSSVSNLNIQNGKKIKNNKIKIEEISKIKTVKDSNNENDENYENNEDLISKNEDSFTEQNDKTFVTSKFHNAEKSINKENLRGDENEDETSNSYKHNNNNTKNKNDK